MVSKKGKPERNDRPYTYVLHYGTYRPHPDWWIVVEAQAKKYIEKDQMMMDHDDVVTTTVASSSIHAHRLAEERLTASVSL